MENMGDFNTQGTTTADGPLRSHSSDAPSIGDLFKQLGEETSHLLRQEIRLARTELKETGERVRNAAVQIALAASVALAGAFALTAFLVVALGDVINNYWAAALIVAALLIGVASAMLNRAMNGLKGHIGIPKTAQTLRDDAQWAKEEAREFKRELTA